MYQRKILFRAVIFKQTHIYTKGTQRTYTEFPNSKWAYSFSRIQLRPILPQKGKIFSLEGKKELTGKNNVINSITEI